MRNFSLLKITHTTVLNKSLGSTDLFKFHAIASLSFIESVLKNTKRSLLYTDRLCLLLMTMYSVGLNCVCELENNLYTGIQLSA